MIDSTFTNIDTMFFNSLKNGKSEPKRDSFDRNYLSLVDVNDVNVSTDNKPFFD